MHFYKAISPKINVYRTIINVSKMSTHKTVFLQKENCKIVIKFPGTNVYEIIFKLNTYKIVFDQNILIINNNF